MRDLTPKEIEWWNKFVKVIQTMPKNLRVLVKEGVLALTDEEELFHWDSIETKKIKQDLSV